MNEFFKDYKTMVLDPQCEFLKKHWKGYALSVIAIEAGVVAVGYLYLKKVNKEIKEENLEQEILFGTVDEVKS